MLLGVASGDAVADAQRLAGKVARLRIFENDDGRFDRSLLDVSGEALVVSQFTLIADSKRRRELGPSFTDAADPGVAEPLYERFCAALEDEGVRVSRGSSVRGCSRARQRRVVTLASSESSGSHGARLSRPASPRCGAILPAPHFTGFTKWARRAHFC